MKHRFWINLSVVLALALGLGALRTGEQLRAQAAVSETSSEIANGKNVQLIGQNSELGYAVDVAVAGNYAYVADYEEGLHVVDITNPASPILRGSYPTAGHAKGVAVAGNYAYLVHEMDGGLRIIDVSDPFSPLEKGFYSMTGDGESITMSGDYAYIANGTEGLQIIDVSVPSSPQGVGSYDTNDLAHDVAVAGDYAFVANGGEGLRIIDVSRPITPTEIGPYWTTDALGIAVSGNIAYVADRVDGLQIVDISDPTMPHKISDVPGVTLDVAVADSMAYIVTGSSGLRVIDVSNPAAPTEVGYYDTAGDALRLAAAEDLAYVADGGEGLLILKYTVPSKVNNVFLPCTFSKYCPDFFDNFSNPASGWENGEDDYVRSEYLDGEFRIMSKNDQYFYIFGAPTCTRENYSVQVDARWVGSPGGSYGILFGIVGDFEQFYIFDINTDYGDYRLWRYDGNTFHTSIPLTTSGAIQPGNATNHLKVQRVGSQIRLEINGSNLGTWNDRNISGSTGVGILSMPYDGEPVSDARFDNFSVGLLNSGTQVVKNNAKASTAAASTYEPGYRKFELDWR